MKIKIKRIDKSLPLPQYHTKGSVGFDIYSRLDLEIKGSERVAIPSNLIINTPKGFMLMLTPRSSTFKKTGLVFPHSVGIIDQDYCGEDDEMLIQVFNTSKQSIKVSRGERIAQGIFVPVEIAEWEEVETMAEVSRGGLGSTN